MKFRSQLCNEAYMAGRLLILPLFCSSKRTLEVRKIPLVFRPPRCLTATTAAIATKSKCINGGVVISYVQGILEITVPLPSQPRICHLILKPIKTTVKDFLARIKSEDKGIEYLAIYSIDGVRLATSTRMEILMQEDFFLHLNDQVYAVTPPPFESLTSEQLDSLSNVKSLVSRFHEILHTTAFHEDIRRRSHRQLKNLRLTLEPLEKENKELSLAIEKRQTIASWVCLSIMGMQLGIIARLTWWEFSWDVMEPITYFITYGTTIAMYAYYILTKQEYTFPGLRDRNFLSTIYHESKTRGIDVNQYNQVRNAISQIKEDLNRLKDSQGMSLPIKELGRKINASQK